MPHKVRQRKALAMGFFRGKAPPNAYEGEKLYGKPKPKMKKSVRPKPKKKKKLQKRYYA
jgi:hypothetical protein